MKKETIMSVVLKCSAIFLLFIDFLSFFVYDCFAKISRTSLRKGLAMLCDSYIQTFYYSCIPLSASDCAENIRNHSESPIYYRILSNERVANLLTCANASYKSLNHLVFTFFTIRNLIISNM